MKLLYLLVFVLAMLLGLFITGCTAELRTAHWDGCINACNKHKPPLVKISKNISNGFVECLCADGVWHPPIGKQN